MTSTLWSRYQGWTAADIVAMKGAQQENRHLDFKLLAKSDFGADDQRHLAKSVSGFANADGGVIIWGVDARRDPKDDYIDQVVATPGVENPRQVLAKLNGLSADTTSPGLPGLDHRILEGGEGVPSFVATFVPEGESGPYMAMLGEARHRYYRRIGSAFTPMDHSMVADMFGRRARPVLEVQFIPESTARLQLRAIVTNAGRGIARATYLMLHAPAGFRPMTMDGPVMPFRPGTPGWLSFGENMDSVIHPGLARQLVPLQTDQMGPTSPLRTEAQTIDYRLGAADIPEVCGRILVTFEPARVVTHEILDLS
ncbi:MAG TPA: ATP-binding protein [Burkholderiaceae bacterium]